MEVISQLNVRMATFLILQMKQSKKTLLDFHGVYFIALQVVKCINAPQIPKTMIYQMASAEQGVPLRLYST